MEKRVNIGQNREIGKFERRFIFFLYPRLQYIIQYIRNQTDQIYYQLRKGRRKAKSHCFARSGRHGRQGVILDCNKDGSHESNSLVGEALLMTWSV